MVKYKRNLNLESDNDREKYIGKIFSNRLFGDFEVVGVYDNKGSKTNNKRYIVRFISTQYETLALGHHIISGSVKDSFKPIIYNQGYFGNIDHVKRNPYYRTWVSMLQRCYDEKFQIKAKSYIYCEVYQDWKCFELFLKDVPNILGYKEMIQNSEVKFSLDKDILNDEQLYKLQNCMFVPAKLNNFFTNIQSTNTSGLVGVSYHKQHQKYAVNVNENGKYLFIGYYSDKHEAFIDYYNAKRKVLQKYLEEYDFLDSQIKTACINKLDIQYQKFL